jgi:hypothetical protein
MLKLAIFIEVRLKKMRRTGQSLNPVVFVRKACESFESVTEAGSIARNHVCFSSGRMNRQRRRNVDDREPPRYKLKVT